MYSFWTIRFATEIYKYYIHGISSWRLFLVKSSLLKIKILDSDSDKLNPLEMTTEEHGWIKILKSSFKCYEGPLKTWFCTIFKKAETRNSHMHPWQPQGTLLSLEIFSNYVYCVCFTTLLLHWICHFPLQSKHNVFMCISTAVLWNGIL